MDLIKDLLNFSQQGKLQVVNISDSSELSLCLNLLSIPKCNAVAVTITVMKDGKKKNALPPWTFAAVMRVFEKLLKDIDDREFQNHGTYHELYFKPVSLKTEWYKVLNCHRIFFIPELSVSDFISAFLSKGKLNVVKESGNLASVSLVVNTLQYYFNSSF